MFLPYEVEIDDEPRQQHAWVTWALLLAIGLVHLYVFAKLNQAQQYDLWWRLGASRFNFHWWQVLTCTFLHGGIMHLLGNGYMLWIYGSTLEKAEGWLRFLAVYWIGALGSMAVHLATTPLHKLDEPAIGASGAIAAVFGAFIILMPHAKLRCLFFSVISFRPIMVVVPAWVILGLWFAGQLAWTLGILGHMDGIAFWAHVAGFVTGAAVGSVLKLQRQKRLDAWVQQVRGPYLEAWTAWLNGDPSVARRRWDTIRDETLPEAAGGAALLDAILTAEFPEDSEETPLECLERAFIRARDYQDNAKAVTVYLQMLAQVSARQIPARFHRDAGFLALSLRQHDLALYALRQAMSGGMIERHEQLLRALVGIYRTQGRQDLADEIARWLPDGGADFKGHFDLRTGTHS